MAIWASVQSVGVGQQVAQPLVAGECGPGPLGHPVEVLAGEQSGAEGAPRGQTEADAVVEGGVLLLDPVPPQQVVLGLLDHRLVEVVPFGDVPRLA
jgi:hypothetical protein